MGYSIDPISANCYPGTTILINKFDIQDEEKLNEIESVLSSARYAEWESAPQSSAFDFEGTQFPPAENIKHQAELIFKRLKELNYFKGLSRNEFVEEIVDFYCITNALHPFREGNGRTQRAFLTQLIRNAGYDISFADMDTELLMIATIQSAQGVTDMLKQIFVESIK